MAVLFRFLIPAIGIGLVVMLLRTYASPATPSQPEPVAPPAPIAVKPGGKVTWQPVGTPFIFAFDGQGKLTLEVSRSIPTPWGRFGIDLEAELPFPGGGSQPSQAPGAQPAGAQAPPSHQQRVDEIQRESPRPKGGFVLTLRDRRRPPDEIDSVYALQSGDDSPITIWLDGRSAVHVADQSVFIDVSNVRCLAISKTVAPDQNAWTRCVSYNATEGWLQNHRRTEMWSGPRGQDGVVSFGVTSQQFCSFLRVRPEEDGRIQVLNPYTDNVFWVDAQDVGPVVGPPPRIERPNPPDQNCAKEIYDR